MTKMNDDGGLIGMRTEDLRVQALKNPLGINENPVFSWQLDSGKIPGSPRGQLQSDGKQCTGDRPQYGGWKLSSFEKS